MNSWTNVKKAIVDSAIEEMFRMGFTPHIGIYTDHPDYRGAPGNKEGHLLISIGMNAVLGYCTNDEYIKFRARVNGVVYYFTVPYCAVSSLTTREDPELFWGMEVSVEDEPSQVTESVIKKPRVKLVDYEEENVSLINPDAHIGWHASATVH